VANHQLLFQVPTSNGARFTPYLRSMHDFAVGILTVGN